MPADPTISIIPKGYNDGSDTDHFMLMGIEGDGFILQGELSRPQLEELSDEISKALGDSDA